MNSLSRPGEVSLSLPREGSIRRFVVLHPTITIRCTRIPFHRQDTMGPT